MGGADPPAVAYLYAPGRGAEHAVRHLAGFRGVLQVAGYDALTDAKRSGWKSLNVVLRYVEYASTKELHERRWQSIKRNRSLP